MKEGRMYLVTYRGETGVGFAYNTDKKFSPDGMIRIGLSIRTGGIVHAAPEDCTIIRDITDEVKMPE